MKKMIFLKQVLSEMKKLDRQQNPIPFDIKVWAFNEQNKSAGRVKIYEGATLMQKGRFRKYATNPNHFENRTRNIKLPNGDIKKIHIIFIKEFNNKKVVF